MKNYFGIIAILLAASSSFAQKTTESQVPSAVKQGFETAYPNSKSVKWDKENDGWEASFTQNKMEMSVVIDNNGAITEVESEIAENQLPAVVKNSFNKEFKDYKIKEIAKIVASATTTYEIETSKGKGKFEFIFDSNGKLLVKKELKKEKEEKD